MKSTLIPSAFLLAALAPHSAAQTPTFTLVGNIANGASNDCDTVVAGGSGPNVFRWTPADGLVSIGGPGSSSAGDVSLSRDGSTITATTIGGDGQGRASIWTGGTTWMQLPGLGGASGTQESSSFGVNGDGSLIVGLGWINAGTAHGFTWTAGTGTVDLGSTVANRSTRANEVSDDGLVVIGWQDQATGVRQGAKWIGGVQSLFNYNDPVQGMLPCGEAQVTNKDGSIICGNTIFSGDNSGWRWDAQTGQTTLLPNLPGEPGSNRAIPTGMIDDGSLICGTNGGSPFTRKSILWINGQPNDLYTYLTSLGTPGIGGYTSLGTALGISADGRVIVGFGQGAAFGMPAGGWVVVLPEPTPSTVGTPFCFGDGSGALCPCGNTGASGHGCSNSTDASGGVLTSTGVASVTNDSVKLVATHMRNTNCVFVQGTSQTVVPVFDGIRCAGGFLIRLGVESGDLAGTACYPKPGSSDQPVSVRGMLPGSGGTFVYQVWYRDPDPSFCSVDTSNWTSAYSLVWAP
jgi:uncharacterized membrane protein